MQFAGSMYKCILHFLEACASINSSICKPLRFYSKIAYLAGFVVSQPSEAQALLYLYPRIASCYVCRNAKSLNVEDGLVMITDPDHFQECS